MVEQVCTGVMLHGYPLVKQLCGELQVTLLLPLCNEPCFHTCLDMYNECPMHSSTHICAASRARHLCKAYQVYVVFRMHSMTSSRCYAYAVLAAAWFACVALLFTIRQ